MTLRQAFEDERFRRLVLGRWACYAESEKMMSVPEVARLWQRDKTAVYYGLKQWKKRHG